jgi:murein DD-endopeptidase MepM/ murein hydrolase activator NlpD
MASALGACAMDAPEYPIREAATAPVRAAPAASSPAPAIVTTNTLRQPVRADAAATADAAQADQGPTPASDASPASAAPEPSPIIEAPSGATVAPPVNHRPGADVESAPLPPAPAPAAAPPPETMKTSSRASRRHAAPPPPAPAARPLVAGKVVSVNDTSHTIEVEKGDTVNTISDGLMTPKESLIKANKLRKPFELEVGRVLKIPVRKAYVVQSGDSLYGIARRFSTPVDVLSDINKLDAKSHLHPGEKIALPELSKDTGPERAPESSAALARAEETPPMRRPGPAADDAMADNVVTAETPRRSDPYAAPTTPRPYSSVSPRPPARSVYPPAATIPEATPSVSDSQIQVAGRGRFIWPVRGDVLSTYGPKPGGQRNDGVDIGAADHAAVRAAASGDVVYAGDQIPGFGNLVLIKHEGGWVTAYAHLSLSEVKIKQHVSQGDEIGQVGESGGVSQPELHFEIRYASSPHDKARPIDPSLVLSGLADQ